MRSCYICGPMRGIPYFNFPAFDQAAALGRSLGWNVLNPAEIDRAAGFDETQYPTGEADFTPDGIRAIIARDVAAIQSLKFENGDALAVLPGWDTSDGALGEIGLARFLMLELVDATTFNPIKEMNYVKEILTRIMA